MIGLWFFDGVGTIGEWVSGLATLAAVLVALRVSWREGEWRRGEETAAGFDAARKVRPPVPDTLGAFLVQTLGHVNIENATDKTVRDVDAVVYLKDGRPMSAPRIEGIGPGRAITTSVKTMDDPTASCDNEDGTRTLIPVVAMALEFQDASNRRWRVVDDEVYLHSRDRLWRRRWRRVDGRLFRDPRPALDTDNIS